MAKLPLISAVLTAALIAGGPLEAQVSRCEDDAPSEEPIQTAPEVILEPWVARLFRYTAVAAKHHLSGLASYYSMSLDGTLTANGEIYRAKKLSAAHLTLPLGCRVEIRSRATGKKIRLRVNDRGPYAKKFVIDLSRSAARALGVDVTEDRSVLIRIISLPGEDLLPAKVLRGPQRMNCEEAP
jgi:rare lipoprotein A